MEIRRQESVVQGDFGELSIDELGIISASLGEWIRNGKSSSMMPLPWTIAGMHGKTLPTLFGELSFTLRAALSPPSRMLGTWRLAKPHRMHLSNVL